VAFSTPSLTGRALRLLSQREHSRRELELKLARFEEQPGSLAAALDDLQAKGFISQERVIASVIHQRASKLGAMRVRQELLEKGLDPAAVADAVDQLRQTELDRARAVWQKKFGAPPPDARERGRQSRFLSSRGFSGQVIQRLLAASDNDGGD